MFLHSPTGQPTCSWQMPTVVSCQTITLMPAATAAVASPPRMPAAVKGARILDGDHAHNMRMSLCSGCHSSMPPNALAPTSVGIMRCDQRAAARCVDAVAGAPQVEGVRHPAALVRRAIACRD